MNRSDQPERGEGPRIPSGDRQWCTPELVRFRPGHSEGEVLPGISGIPPS